MTKKTLHDLANAMLHEIDQIALADLEYGTPIYNFQQIMIKNAAKLRIAQYKRSGNSEND